jgi:hypothetical protein
LRVGAKPKTVNRARRYDDESRAIELRPKFLDDHTCRSRCDQYALTQLGMPMCADLPKIFSAAGLDVFDVHRSRHASCRTLLTVQ